MLYNATNGTAGGPEGGHLNGTAEGQKVDSSKNSKVLENILSRISEDKKILRDELRELTDALKAEVISETVKGKADLVEEYIVNAAFDGLSNEDIQKVNIKDNGKYIIVKLGTKRLYYLGGKDSKMLAKMGVSRDDIFNGLNAKKTEAAESLKKKTEAEQLNELKKQAELEAKGIKGRFDQAYSVIDGKSVVSEDDITEMEDFLFETTNAHLTITSENVLIGDGIKPLKVLEKDILRKTFNTINRYCLEVLSPEDALTTMQKYINRYSSLEYDVKRLKGMKSAIEGTIVKKDQEIDKTPTEEPTKPKRKENDPEIGEGDLEPDTETFDVNATAPMTGNGTQSFDVNATTSMAGNGTQSFDVKNATSPAAGNGTETFNVQNATSPAAGNGTETFDVNATAPMTGNGTQSFDVNATTSMAGNGTETFNVQNATSPAAGNGTQSFDVQNATSPAAGNGTETFNVQNATSPVAGNGTETFNVQNATSPAAGNGTQSFDVNATTSMAGNGTETFDVQNATSPAAGNGTETIVVEEVKPEDDTTEEIIIDDSATTGVTSEDGKQEQAIQTSSTSKTSKMNKSDDIKIESDVDKTEKYTVVKGDVLWNIVKAKYNLTDNSQIAKACTAIVNYKGNEKIRNRKNVDIDNDGILGDMIIPGDVITLPAFDDLLENGKLPKLKKTTKKKEVVEKAVDKNEVEAQKHMANIAKFQNGEQTKDELEALKDSLSNLKTEVKEAILNELKDAGFPEERQEFYKGLMEPKKLETQQKVEDYVNIISDLEGKNLPMERYMLRVQLLEDRIFKESQEVQDAVLPKLRQLKLPIISSRYFDLISDLEGRDLPMDNYRRGIKLLPEMFSKENPYTRGIVLEELEKLDLSQDKKVFYKGVLEGKEEIKNSDDEKIEDER